MDHITGTEEGGYADQTIQLLKECGNGCQMAQSSVKHVRKFVTDEKLSELLEAYGEKHTELEKRIIAMLSGFGESEEEPGKMAQAGSWMNVEMNMLIHPDNREAAKLMMDGCNMGIQSVSGYLNMYAKADGKAKELAREVIKTEEDFMTEMKAFV